MCAGAVEAKTDLKVRCSGDRAAEDVSDVSLAGCEGIHSCAMHVFMTRLRRGIGRAAVEATCADTSADTVRGG